MPGTLSEGDEYSNHCPVVDSVPGVLDINRQQSTTSRQRVCHCRLTWHLRSTQGPGDMDRFSELLAYKFRLQVCVLEKEERERESWQRNMNYDTRGISPGTWKRDRNELNGTTAPNSIGFTVTWITLTQLYLQSSNGKMITND